MRTAIKVALAVLLGCGALLLVLGLIIWTGIGDHERLAARHEHAVTAVVAHDLDVLAQLGEVLHQVVGEGVVVVDQQQTRAHSPSSANCSARRSAALLANTSACSASGSLSATTPAPA